LILSVLSLGIAAIAHAEAAQPISTIGRAEVYTPAHDRPRPRMKRDLPSATLDAGAVAQRIREALRAGHWPPGSRLPTERAMAESLGLSRAAVRKALAALKTEGLISQRVGSGTYANAPLPSMAQIGPAELMRARIAFEPQIAELAVHNATAADFARMDECLAMAEQASSVDDFELWDARLHDALAEATHNAMVVLVFRMMSDARRHGEWGSLKRRSGSGGPAPTE
jgi:DNA-binding FadR family transcriptional regulator